MVVLDTHVWLWWVATPDKLSRAARQAIDGAEEVGVSAISAWEIAMLVDRGRITLDRPPARWVRDAIAADGRTVAVPLSAAVAVAAGQLGGEGLHGDPADRFIYATARDRRAQLVTRDTALRAFDPAGTVW